MKETTTVYMSVTCECGQVVDLCRDNAGNPYDNPPVGKCLKCNSIYRYEWTLTGGYMLVKIEA